MANTTVNDFYPVEPGNPVILNMKIGHGQLSKTFVLLGNRKIQETLESSFSIVLTEFKNPIKGAVLRVRCIVDDTQRSGKSFVDFTLTGGAVEFDPRLPDNKIEPIGGIIIYTFRILFT